MAIERALLLIADIGGYTRFMREHRFSLAHAQDAVARLLEAVIDAADGFNLAKLEGDAAFFYAPGSDFGRFARGIAAIRRAFLRERQRLSVVNSWCNCAACTQVGTLKLKFVSHHGEVAFQRVKQFTELAGVDVILVHRMLKNDVPVPEYLLMTDAVLSGLPEELRRFARPIEHEFEGIGRTTTHYIDLAEIAADPPEVVPVGFGGRLWHKVKQELRGLPYVLGMKKPCEAFRNVEIVSEADVARPTDGPS